ncbi:MAG: HlyD family efflux transporter periplasmic adaptor subunit [Proteobacteria bacterium]|nr:HlyD family efflux transporter periplasmic adaptor subunit [Pseudomonadota bacterium]
MKMPFPAALLAAALTVGGLAGCDKRAADADAALVLYGNVDIRQVSLAFEGSGRVVELKAQEGDAVKAGALLAVLDTRTLALQAEQARAQIDVQAQTLQRLRNGTRPAEVLQARERVVAAQAEQTRAEHDLARLQGVGAATQGRGVSAQDVDRAAQALQAARARTEEQRQALRLAEAGPRQEDIAGAQAQLKVSQAQLALLQHQIEQGRLLAPVDAVVRSRLVEPGDMVAAQRPVLTLALTRPKWIRAYVGEKDLGRLKPGMAAQVSSDSRPDQPISGQLGYISSVAEFTPKSVQTEELRSSLVYEVRITVDDAGNALRLGQPVTVRLATGAAR